MLGNTSGKTINLESGASVVGLDAGTADVNLVGIASTDVTVVRNGTTLEIRNADGDVLVSVAAGTDATTELSFSDGSATMAVSGSDLTFGGQTLADGDEVAGADVTVTGEGSGADEGQTFSLTADSTAVNEGGTATFTLDTTNVAEGTEVAYTISGVDAADVVGGSLTGTTTVGADGTATIDVALAEDASTDEGAETLTLALDNGQATADVTVNDTSVATTFELTAASQTVEEGNALTFTVTANQAVDADTDVTFTLVPGDGTAVNAGTNDTNTNDFGTGSFNPQTVTIPAGSTEVTFDVTPQADGVSELPEDFVVRAEVDGEVVGEVTATAQDASGANAGQTYTLTTGVDSLTGTAGSDTFVGADDGGVTTTSNLGDEIDGAAGTDTVKITTDQAAANIPSLTNIEKLHLVKAGATDHQSVNAAAIAGLKTLELEGGETNATGQVTATMGAGQSLILDSITDGDATGDAGNNGDVLVASSAAVTSVDVTVDGASAQTDVADFTAGNDLDLDITGANVATANLTAVGINNISLANAGTSLETLNVAGEGSVVVQNQLSLESVDASANTGGVTVNNSGLGIGEDVAVTGGSGNDVLTVNLASNATVDAGAGDDVVTLNNATAANLVSSAGVADSIDGGEGTDVLSLTSAGAQALSVDAAADRAVIKNFEILRIDGLDADTDAAAPNDSFDISAFGLNSLQVTGDVVDSGAGTAQTATVSGFTSGATVETRLAADQSAALNVGMTGATGANTPDDTLNLKLNADLVDQPTAGAPANAFAASFGVDGINKLNVTTADRVNTDGATGRDDGYILNLTNASNVDTITVDGDRELSFTSGTNTDALANFNAADLTGDLIVDLNGFTGTQGVTVTGGAGTNDLTGTDLADIIVGGDRADTITGGAGADSLTGGAGADTFVFATGDYTAASATALAAAADKITDFATASDIIDWSANLTVEQNGAAIGGNAAINAEGFASFATGDDTLVKKITAVEAAIDAGTNSDGDFAIFEDSGNTYVFISEGTSGVGAGDGLVELTGVTGLSDSTITAGDMTIA
ncbi:calcium-binding protein [Halomonas vilamensis]|uniref:Calcium-binding protein n=1 Tax=Vreelandella vilamensis TaxID=531309 RepID=A0ABU1H898_9GAMM|nr:calcium-binding protein [Halomonas vilamensis]MDR5900459.1 calcium-binding protein [Halomonas vilamensis]